MATFTERLMLIVDAKTGGAVREVQKFSNEVRAAGTAQEEAATKTGFLQSKLNALGLEGVNAGALVKTALGVAAAAGVGALVKFTEEGIHKQLELADAVRKVSVVSGLSAEQASRLVEVTGDYGVQVGSVEKAMLRLSVAANTNQDKFAQYGVELAKTKDGHVDLLGTLENMQKAFKASGDASERDAMMLGLLGRGGKDLIPVMEETVSLKKALAEVPESRILSDQDLKNARDYELAMDDFHDVLDAFQRDLAMAVIPTIAQLVEHLNQILETANRVTAPIGGMATAMGTAMDVFNPFGLALHGMSAASDVFAGHFGMAADEVLRGTGLLGTGVATIGEKIGIFHKAAEETTRLTEAQKEYAKAAAEAQRVADSGDEQAKADAARNLAAAEAELSGATKQAAEAIKTENDRQKEAIALGYQRLGQVAGLAGASISYEAALDGQAEAHLKMEEAQNKQAEAQATLDDLVAKGKGNTIEAAAAQKDLEQATLDVRSAYRGLEQSDVAVVQATLSVQQQMDALKQQVKDNKLSWEDYQKQIDILKFTHPQAAAAIDAVAARVTNLAGEIVKVPEKHHTDFDAATDAVSNAAGAAHAAIDSVPFDHWTTFRANDLVSGAVFAINNAISNVRGAVLSWGPERQHGGPIPGSENSPYPIVAHGGEYVLSADVVKRIKSGAPSRGAMVAGGSDWLGGGGGSSTTSPAPIIVQLMLDGNKVGEAMISRVNSRARSGPVFDAGAVRRN